MRATFGRNTVGLFTVMGMQRDRDQEVFVKPKEAEAKKDDGSIPAFPQGFRQPNDKD